MRRIVLVDDVTGEEGAESVTFALDGQVYEIDLGPDSRVTLAGALAPFIAAGRRVRLGVNTPATPIRKPPARDWDPVQVRAWANAHNVPITSRGRIPGPVVEQYHAWQAEQAAKPRKAAAAK